MYILVVGGAGFIGSHVIKLLNKAGYQTIALDNLSRGNKKMVQSGLFIHGDLSDSTLLDKIFSEHPITAVMHFAALTDVGESVINPIKYYTNNVANTLTLLNAMQKHSIKTFVFSSSAAIFGNPIHDKIAENHPCNPINPYGTSKLMVEQILADIDHAYGIKSCCLRYFNAAGGDPDGLLKNYNFPRKETNLIPIILKSLTEPNGVITINGTDYPTPDGTCIRDYIHIDDLATVHITAMDQLLNGAPSNQYNLGNGHGFSIREVIAAACKVTGQKLQVREGPRRPGDPPILVADSQKARKELTWKPKYPSLELMIEHAWKAIPEKDEG